MPAASAKETLCQLLRARDLGFLSKRKFEGFEERIEEIRQMLWSLAEEVRRQHGGDR